MPGRHPGGCALLQSSVSVQASPAMMPGIEQIVNDTTAEKPFKILEIVDNTSEAEIGYYVSGQEPYVKLYQYQYTDDKNQAHTITFDSLDEGLSKNFRSCEAQRICHECKTESGWQY